VSDERPLNGQQLHAIELQEDREALAADPGWEDRLLGSGESVWDGLKAILEPPSAERLAVLRRMDYRTEYLRTPEWRQRRAWLLAATGYRCDRCNTYDKHLDAHHLTYERLGAEAPGDIVALCRPCHRAQHDREAG
jgi:hypothetical protein